MDEMTKYLEDKHKERIYDKAAQEVCVECPNCTAEIELKVEKCDSCGCFYEVGKSCLCGAGGEGK